MEVFYDLIGLVYVWVDIMGVCDYLELVSWLLWFGDYLCLGVC